MTDPDDDYDYDYERDVLDGAPDPDIPDSEYPAYDPSRAALSPDGGTPF